MRGSRLAKFYGQSLLTEVRYLPQVTLSSIAIQKDTVDMLVWTGGASLVFVVKSREVAGTFRGYFEILWKTAKK